MPSPLPDPFATALVALFGAPGSEAAIYAAPGGTDQPIRIIRDNGRDIQGGIIFDTETVQIQRSDIANPVKGARLTIGDEAFTIQGQPQLDRERLTWTCPLQPA